MHVVTKTTVITDYHCIELAAAEAAKMAHPLETLGNKMSGEMAIVGGKVAFEFPTLADAQAFEAAVAQLPQKPQI